MHCQSFQYSRPLARTAIGFLLCLGSYAALAGGQASTPAGDVTAETPAKNPKHVAVRAKVEEPRIPTKPQRAVKQLKQK